MRRNRLIKKSIVTIQLFKKICFKLSPVKFYSLPFLTPTTTQFVIIIIHYVHEEEII